MYGVKDLKKIAYVSRELGHAIRKQVRFSQTSAEKVDVFALALISLERKQRLYGKKMTAAELGRNMDMGRGAMYERP